MGEFGEILQKYLYRYFSLFRSYPNNHIEMLKNTINAYLLVHQTTQSLVFWVDASKGPLENMLRPEFNNLSQNGGRKTENRFSIAIFQLFDP